MVDYRMIFEGISKGSNMSDRAYAKALAQQKTLIGPSSKYSLLHRTCACGQHTVAGGECSTCRSEQSTLHRSQRAFEHPSAPGAVPGSSPAQENGTSFNSVFDRASRFDHDFSRIPIHPPAVGKIQTKLAINKPGDEYEREANQIADKMLAAPTHSAASGARAHIQHFTGQPTGQADTSLASADRVLASPGTPLDPALQADMAQSFGHDFSRVRVHSGTAAEVSAHEVNANAHAVGQNGRLPPLTQHPQFDFAHIPITVPQIQRKPIISSPGDPFERVADDEGADSDRVHEIEADRTADEVVRRLDDAPPRARGAAQAPASDLAGLGGGRPVSADLRRRFEGAFGWDFSGVRLHAGSAAADVAARLGARAFAYGRDVVFGDKVSDPEASDHRRLLAHELTHVVQQDMGAGACGSLSFSSLSSASPGRVQAAPRVTNVVSSAAELGVGGNDITATATVAGAGTPLTWTINPGGAAPAGVSVIGTGRRVRIHAAQRGAGAAIGGNPIIIRAALTGAPGDFFDAPGVLLVQVVSATYANNPALANVPSPIITGIFPRNTAEPNRDGIVGNTALVNAITAPAGRPITVAFRHSLGAAVAGNVITPGSRTGNIDLRITDTATRARLNETIPSAVNPPVPMATMVVNAVPTRVSALGNTGPLGPYGQLDPITFASSDNLHPPLTRIVGELITLVRDDFNVPPVNAAQGGFNNAFLLALAVPANNWNDRLITPAGWQNAADGRPAIDINRFAGPGVPHLPRRLIFRQRMQYSSWQGAGAVVSRTIADGQHIRSLIGSPAAPQFRTEHHFGGVHAPSAPEPYVGNRLIVLSNVQAAPTAVGATGLAADGAATANLSVNPSVPGRTVNWSILSGDIAITAGNPAALPATATLRAGVRTGNFRVRAADLIFPNRRVDGQVRVVPVRLRNLRAAPSRVPVGTLASNVTVTAEPGGRTLNWVADAAATAAGVTVAPAVTGPGLAMNVTVTRPPGFTGRVTVTATDSVLAARTGTVRIQFL
jgi:hypothetical protein